MVGEQRQRSEARTPTVRKNKGSLLIFGTIAALVVAGIGVQVLRAKRGDAGEESGQAGTARVQQERPVARVAGKSIMYDEVARECMDRFGREVLENVINRTVIQQACTHEGIQVTGAEVNAEILQISKRFGLDQSSWYKMLEAERGLNPVQYRRDVIWPMLALKKLAGTELEITDEELRKAYEDAYGTKVRVKMIMFDKMRHAQKVWEAVSKAPEDFERYAREESIEPNSRAIGGTIPPIRKHSGAHPEVRRAAFQMRQPDEVSGIIQVGVDRYVILKNDGRTEPVPHNFKDVRAQLHEELVETEVQKMVAHTFRQLKDKTSIDNFLTGKSTGGTRQVSAAGSNTGPVRQVSQQRPATGKSRDSYPQTATRQRQPSRTAGAR
jgi:foldase protein PrsA